VSDKIPRPNNQPRPGLGAACGLGRRVKLLHRELLAIAKLLELDEVKGLAEFLDELCRCEKKHNPGTMGK